MDSLINWRELQRLFMPMPQSSPGQGNMWDANSKMYNMMADMEREYTLNQINAFETFPSDTVLDVGCGPGRITVPMAKRAKSVTALDSSPLMLEKCMENVRTAGLTNVEPLLMDWNDAVKDEKLQKHDIVICSRTEAMRDLERVSKVARRLVAVVIWANAPSIPPILDRLFAGTSGGEERRMRPQDRRVAYNLMFNIVYDLGYEPNIHIVTDGFTKDFESPEAAYSYLGRIRDIAPGKESIFQQNVNPFLSKNAGGGVTFRIETRTAVLWWNTNPQTYEHIWNPSV